MKLYYSEASPYARKVRVALRELGLAEFVDEILADPYTATPELLAVNPLSKVPALVTEKGENLPDSSLIVEYLLTRGRGLAPLPRGMHRWILLRRQQLGEGLMNAAVAARMEMRRPPEFVLQSAIDRQFATVNRTLDALNAEAADLLHEGPVRTVDITVAAALGFLDYRLPQLNWREGRERLGSWYFVFSQRPSMRATQPPAPA
jgi:glutathione S-transferase